MFRTGLLCALLALSWPVGAQSPSPYAGQETREIKALSSQEVSDYLSGKGLGLAKAAELNGYPGPAHVLEMAVQLGLTPRQKANTEDLFKRMQARAIPLGKTLVEEERLLDRLFAARSVTPEALGSALVRIAKLQGEIRQAHLDAHLEQMSLLSPEQVGDYNRIRGYGSAPRNENHQHKLH